MARKKSNSASEKKAATRTAFSKKTTLEFDDIELLNAHRYPESFAASKLARIRNSKSAQERLKYLLKTMPSSQSKANRERDSSAFPNEDPNQKQKDGLEYEDKKYVEELAQEKRPVASGISKFFRRRNS